MNILTLLCVIYFMNSGIVNSTKTELALVEHAKEILQKHSSCVSLCFLVYIFH